MKQIAKTVCILAIIVLAGCKPKSHEPAKPSDQGKNFYLFFTNDLNGEVDLCGCPMRKMGGIARRAKYIERIVEMKNPVLQVDAGDGFFREHMPNESFTTFEKDSALILARGDAKLKVDAVNVGALDLYLGAQFVKELKEKAGDKGKLNLISSNLVDKNTGQPVFETEKTVERAGVKFGIFGLCRQSPAVPAELAVRDPKTVSEEMVKKLKTEKKVDLVIGLFNLGQDETRKICKQVPGIDIAVISGAPSYIWNPELVDNTLMVQSGIGGKYLGQLEMNFSPVRRSKAADQIDVGKLKDRLDRLNAQMALFEGEIQNQPEGRARYLELKGERDSVKAQLEKISLPFDFKHTLVPMDELMPVDVEIKGWIVRAFRADKGQN